MPSAMDREVQRQFARTARSLGMPVPDRTKLPAVAASLRIGNPHAVRRDFEAALGRRGNPPHPNSVSPPAPVSHRPPTWAIATAAPVLVASIWFLWRSLDLNEYGMGLNSLLSVVLFVAGFLVIDLARRAARQKVLDQWFAWFAGATMAPRRS